MRNVGYTFDYSGLPAGSTIVEATLRLYQAVSVGDPYGKFAGIFVDHVHFDAGTGGAVFDGDWYRRGLGPLSTTPDPGYRDLDVAEEVRDDLARGRQRTQLRVRFSAPSPLPRDDRSDYVQFTDGEDSCCDVSHAPVLILRYVAP